LHQKRSWLVSFARFRYRLHFSVINPDDFTVFNDYKLSIVLPHQSVLILKVKFKLLFQRHKVCHHLQKYTPRTDGVNE